MHKRKVTNLGQGTALLRELEDLKAFDRVAMAMKAWEGRRAKLRLVEPLNGVGCLEQKTHGEKRGHRDDLQACVPWAAKL